jgi:plasmid stabilization system protein ParE
MKLRWHAEARAEADAAAAFYNDKQSGLAQRFLDDLEEALHRIQRHPQAYRQVEVAIRKCRRPPRMAEGRAMQEQLPSGAFPLRDNLSGANRCH